jgi:hypothetical protein
VYSMWFLACLLVWLPAYLLACLVISVVVGIVVVVAGVVGLLFISCRVFGLFAINCCCHVVPATC